MSIYHCVMRIVLIGIISAASPAITTPQDRTGSDKSETVSPKVRRQAKELALRFRRANDDVVLLEQIADESIQMGRPYAEKVLGAAVFDKTKSLKSYGADFSKQIDKADKISAEGVISSSKKLQRARERLVQLAKTEDKLRAFLDPIPRGQGAGDKKPNQKETDQNATTEFEKNLRVEEDRVVEQWLLKQGYRMLTGDESSVITAINRMRQEAGLEKLEVDYKLCFAARDHSRDMVRKQFFSHKSPVRGKKTFAHRAHRLGTVAYAENIAHCNLGESPVTLWINSKPHKKNMFGKGYNTIGVGRAGKNYTAMFGRKTPPKSKTPNNETDQ